MKQLPLYSLLIILLITLANCGKPKAISAKVDNTRFIRSSQMTVALLLRRLGSKSSTKALFNKIHKKCLHLKFLGKKLYRKFKLTKKLKKSQKKQKRFASSFVKFVLRRILTCSVVRKHTLAYKFKSALRRVNRARKSPRIIHSVLRLAKSFRGPKISLKKKRNPRVPKLVKKFSKKKSTKAKKNKKNLKKTVKKLKRVRNLKKSLAAAQKRCRRNGFKKQSAPCQRAVRLSRTYRSKAKKVKKVVVKNCKKLKIACFKRNWKCKQMFKICRKAKKVTKSLRNTKATHFARLFAAIIARLN